MRKSVSFGGLLVLALLCGLWASRASAQAVYGSIAGTVTDPQGAAVVGAKVIVRDQNKGTSTETTTNESGNYSVTHLVPDAYTVRIEAQGFKGTEAKDVIVNVDTSSRVDLQVQLGSASESVEVTSELPQLKTDRADVATTFDTKQIEDLPIYNRNFTTFQLLSPGTQRLNGWNHAASENPQGSQQILTNGQHFAGTAFELDGTDNQDPILGIIVINPNLDSINEVKITSQDYDAEFGKAIGAVVTSQTKSGTNEIHGSAFDFERSNSNFARNPFTQSPAKGGVPSGNWNQFGGTVGGPIRKNKLFAFGDYQGQRSHVGGTSSDRVPSALERGNITAGTGADLSIFGKNIYDPCTDNTGTFHPACDVAPANRQKFANNIIPANRLSPQAEALLSLIPLPNATPSTALGDNFFAAGNNTLDSNGFDVRSDFVATSKVNVFGRYSFQQFKRSGPGLFGVDIGGHALPSDPSVGDFAGNSSVRNQSIASGFDYTLSPTLLTDIRFGYMRYRVNVSPGGFGTTPAKDAGIPGVNLNATTSSMPAFTILQPGTS